MLRVTVALTFALYTAFVLVMVKECAFLRPLIGTIWRDYQEPVLLFSALFVFNGGAAIHQLVRRLMLADTGDKLAYLEKQLRGRSSISKELTERILEER
jgi:hypothetical protein